MHSPFIVKPLVLAIAALGVVPLLATAAPTQPPAPAQQPAPQQQAIAKSLAVNIAAGPLDRALNQLAQTAGEALSYDPALVQSKTTQGVKGQYSLAQALGQLLTDTGLSASQHGSGGGFVVVATNSGVMMLDPVKVGAAALQETAYGPVDGYVAKRSATGTKTNTRLVAVPQSISVVGSAAIRAHGSESISQSVSYSAGIQPFANFNPGADLFHIRGIEDDNGIFLDGTQQRVNRFDSIVEPYGVERIEVLRGPSSVLYGGSSPGGLINLVSKRPQDKAHGELGVFVGSNSRKTLTADVGGALSDRVNYRFVALNRSSETQVDYIDNDRLFIAPSMSWDISENTSLTLLSYYQKDETDFPFGYPINGTLEPNTRGEIPSNRFIGEPNFNGVEREHYSISSLFEHVFNDTLSFRQHLRYFDSNADRKELWDINLLGIAPYDSSTGIILRLPFVRDQTSNSLTIDNQLLWRFGNGDVQHQILAGLDYRQTKFDQVIDTDIGALLNPTKYALDLINPVYGSTPVTVNTPQRKDSEEKEQLGIYLQDQISIRDDFLVTLSARYDQTESESSAESLQFSTGQLGPQVTQKTSDDAFSGRIGLTYLTDFGVAPYVSFSRSFLPEAGIDSQGKALKPTIGKQSELGVKYQSDNGNALITLSVFDLVKENVVTISSDLTEKNQLGKVESKGVELEAAIRFENGLSFTSAYTYTDVEITESLRPYEIGLTVVRVPKNSASLWLAYEPETGVLQGLNAGVGARYIGETFDQSNDVRVPSYVVYDASFSYRLQSWELAVTANNLFDKEYISQCTSAIHSTGARLSSSCSYGQRRQMQVGLRYIW
ncbi:MAG: TonB-dependent siderophore receptor [Porticoccaceae bacterium]|nr:TonB-dependent siderophore receptor [Porticoccaceae bacterium]